MTVLMTMTHHYVFTFLAGDSMGKIVSAVKLRISQIVLTEQRPFCISDLLEFEVGGQMHRMSYGTARNCISKLKKLGKIELAFKSKPAFYTLSGHKFDKSMTLDHTGVTSIISDSLLKQTPIYKWLKNRRTQKQSIAFRLTFQSDGIWNAFSSV